MQLNRWEFIFIAIALAIAGVSVYITGDPFAVALAAGVFVAIVGLTYRLPYKELYLLAAGEPLAVTVGITNIFAGFLIQLVLIGILLADDIPLISISQQVSLVLIPLTIAIFALFTTSESGVLVPFLVLFISSAIGVFLINVQTQLIKMKYSSEQP